MEKEKGFSPFSDKKPFSCMKNPWAGYTSPIGHHTSAVLVSLTGLI
jgi:hypothetical protein